QLYYFGPVPQSLERCSVSQGLDRRSGHWVIAGAKRKGLVTPALFRFLDNISDGDRQVSPSICFRQKTAWSKQRTRAVFAGTGASFADTDQREALSSAIVWWLRDITLVLA